MITLSDLVDQLGYNDSPQYYSLEQNELPEGRTHLFIAARNVGVRGIYVMESGTEAVGSNQSVYPVVYVADATDADSARRMHRDLWNLGYAPFLVVRLPNQIRVYTGFAYDVADETSDLGLVDKIVEEEDAFLRKLSALLTSFAAVSIDTGYVWESSYAEHLQTSQRIDQHLLANLKRLGEALGREGLTSQIAHALIGKYVYLRYLRDRRILDDEWIAAHGIDPEKVFSDSATVSDLRKLDELIQNRVNGRVFPIDYAGQAGLQDGHVSLVASVTGGSDIHIDGVSSNILQLRLSFQAYNFEYIPIELLSAIYEQFIHPVKRRQKGAIFTPEVLADYIVGQIERRRPLSRGMKVLDPACGSGVFLVLAYRRLIEKQLRTRGQEKLSPEELGELLVEAIYGVERELDACYVAEFSLILTLLHYAEPHYLQELNFQFPELHNRNIFHADFFDVMGENCESSIWVRDLEFDWIVGNPPWIPASDNTEYCARRWIKQHRQFRPVSKDSVAEAFSWAVLDLLRANGMVGLVMPAGSLVQESSHKYREQFFKQSEVLTITNFANLRRVLFGGRATLSAAAVVYRHPQLDQQEHHIVHYGPFLVNQITSRNPEDKLWALTVGESEVSLVPRSRAVTGSGTIWKMALWGTHWDAQALRRIRHTFPTTLGELANTRGWHVKYGGPQLRTKDDKENTTHEPRLIGMSKLDSSSMGKIGLRFSVPEEALAEVTDHYVRDKGGMSGLRVSVAPHIVLSQSWGSYIAYSDMDFMLTSNRSIGISGPADDTAYLKSAALYLNSSLAWYYLFFQVAEWGINRQARRVALGELKSLAIPHFTQTEAERLAAFHDSMVGKERRKVDEFLTAAREPGLLTMLAEDDQWRSSENSLTELIEGAPKDTFGTFLTELQASLQQELDQEIFTVFGIPEDIQILVRDFVAKRLPLDSDPSIRRLRKLEVSSAELLEYARDLQSELNNFLQGRAYNQVDITRSEGLVQCVVEITEGIADVPLQINWRREEVRDWLSEIESALGVRLGHKVLLQYGLRVFHGPHVYIFKSPTVLNWSRSQAMRDAGDIIEEAVTCGLRQYA